MPKKKKKIYLFLAGGTCILGKEGHIFSVNSKKDIDLWLSIMPELSILADIEPVFLSGEDDIVGPVIWQKITKNILARSRSADGFVVITKIDQLINSSLAVNFLLQNFKKSVIFTASQVSGTSFVDKKEIIQRLKSKHGGLGLRTNLINAIQIASEPLPGPAILFGSRLVSSVRAINTYLGDISTFLSLGDKYLAKIDFGINLKSGLKYPSKKIAVFPSLLAKVLILDDLPGTDWTFDQQELSGYDGLFIRALPFQPFERSKQKKINEWNLPTVVYNYHSTPSVKGAVVLSSCTENAALIKTIWALSNRKKLPGFESIMRQNIIGEFISPG